MPSAACRAGWELADAGIRAPSSGYGSDRVGRGLTGRAGRERVPPVIMSLRNQHRRTRTSHICQAGLGPGPGDFRLAVGGAIRVALTVLVGWCACGALSAATALLLNGDFAQANPADRTRPAGWERVDGLGVQWTSAPDPAHGQAIRMDTRITEQAMQAQWRQTGLTNEWNIPKPDPAPIANTYGLSLYSEAIPVVQGQAYRIAFEFRGAGGGAKVWVRGYGQWQGEKRRRWETYVSCKGNADAWTTCAQVFHPTKFRPEVTELKVLLFAYHPPGVYWFDNVRLEPVTE